MDADDKVEAKQIYEKIMKNKLSIDEIIEDIKKSSYNLDKLIKIKINGFYKSNRYSYKEEKRSWWFNLLVTEKGIHQHWTYGDGVLTEVPEHHVLKDNVVYEIPEVVLFFENDFRYTYHCETVEDADALRDTIKNMTEPEWLDV